MAESGRRPTLAVRPTRPEDVAAIVELSRRVQETLEARGSLQQFGPLDVEFVTHQVGAGAAHDLAGDHVVGSLFVEPLTECLVPVDRWRLRSLSAPLWFLEKLMIDPDWNVLTLAAHIREAPAGLVVRLRTPIAIPPTQERVTYWRFTGSDVAAMIDAEARQAAARLTPEAFRASLDEARRALSGAAPWTVVPLLFGSITVGELVMARIVELTIHTLDLSAALGRMPSVDGQAREHTVGVLEALLERPRPPGLEDDIAFIEAASGRGITSGLVISAFT